MTERVSRTAPEGTIFVGARSNEVTGGMGVGDLVSSDEVRLTPDGRLFLVGSDGCETEVFSVYTIASRCQPNVYDPDDEDMSPL